MNTPANPENVRRFVAAIEQLFERLKLPLSPDDKGYAGASIDSDENHVTICIPPFMDMSLTIGIAVGAGRAGFTKVQVLQQGIVFAPMTVILCCIHAQEESTEPAREMVDFQPMIDPNPLTEGEYRSLFGI